MYSPNYVYLDDFQFGTIMNKAALNILAHTFW